MTAEERRARYVEEMVSSLKTALECAEIVAQYPKNRVALKTAGRNMKVAAAIFRDINRKVEADQ